MPNTSTLPKIAVGIAEACTMISVGETLLREMMDDGSLPFSRVARKGKRGRIVIRVSDLDKFLTNAAVRS